VSEPIVLDHPLVRHHVTRLRDRETGPEEFRRTVQRLAALLAYEATADLPVEAVRVRTPLVETEGAALSVRVGLVPILRAGLGMVDPILSVIPSAEVWHLGVYQDEATARPVEYYSKLPEGGPVEVGLVVDPMLATGGSARSALGVLRRWGVPRLKMLSIIASVEGVRAVAGEFPDVPIVCCALDPELNASKFIVPGLGDAGDRIFNTRA
jgi:uracil phosphoribosyltransferase